MALRIEELDDLSGDEQAVAELLTAGAAELDQAPDEPGEYTPDPDPGFSAPPLLDGLFTGTEKDKPAAGKRVTTAVRKDVRGKLAMMLTLVGGAWSARDPHCGGALLECIPDRDTPEGTAEGIATAITDLVCDSPDMVKWFTSSGRYLKWLSLAMAVQPVLQMAFAHHVSHTVADEGQAAAADDWNRYGAG